MMTEAAEKQFDFGKLRIRQNMKAKTNLFVLCVAEKHGGIEASTMVMFIAVATLANF